MTVPPRRLFLLGALLFLLGGATSEGGATLVRAAQGGDSLADTRIRVLQAATQVDDQRLLALANDADLALAGSDHALFTVVAQEGKAYLDSVVTMRSTLAMSSDDPEPAWFYTCFDSTARAARATATLFAAAGGSATWSQQQGAVVSQTVTDLRTVSDQVDLITTGGQSVAPKSADRPGPNGQFSVQGKCAQIVSLADDLAQRQWPS
jgi:hypothetical protein